MRGAERRKDDLPLAQGAAPSVALISHRQPGYGWSREVEALPQPGNINKEAAA